MRVKVFAERVEARRCEIEIVVDRFIAVCRRRPDVRAVYACGSFATGKIGPRSDLDILVVRVTATVGIERGTDLAAEADLGIALDLIVVTPEEFAEKLPTTTFGQTWSTARQVYTA
jgi:predicted nucleotidyltransferase